MLLLVTDTSGKDGFVGLARGGEGARADQVEVIAEVPLAGGTFSAQLIPQISVMLEKNGVRKTDIGAFIVVSGPGSFTGLRVGLAAVKGLAEILQKPIVPVSLLDVLAPYSRMIAAFHDALPTDSAFRYAVALDAGRGDAYVGEYEITSSSNEDAPPKALGESLLPFDNLAALLESGVARWISTPDQAVFDALGSRMSDTRKRFVRRNWRRPCGAEVAAVGWEKLNAGGIVSPEQLEANYLRRSDAEIFSKPTPAS
jgi:tRNA threonylcarbamoyladenosine biosynthesis protein TsaB